MNFVKVQIPRIRTQRILSLTISICLATIGVCVLGALTSVGALFYLKEKTMEEKKVTTDTIANALTSLCETAGICDKDTTKGIRRSKKKDILKSKKEGSFAKFIGEIKKRQEKK